MRPERIPLFPLNVVLLPGAELPLHIFEPRYREMVKNCLEEESEFGMLLALPYGVARVGCTAEILEVAKRYEDGRMDILTIGRAKFRVVELFPENPLTEGQVDYLEDREAPGNPRVTRELVELFEACHTLIFDDYPKNLKGAAPEALAHLVAASLPMDYCGSSKSSNCAPKPTARSGSSRTFASGRRIYRKKRPCGNARAATGTA